MGDVADLPRTRYAGIYTPHVHRPPATWQQQWVRHHGGSLPDDIEQTYELTVETFNSTSWTTMERRLKTSTAGIILAQEVSTLPGQHAAHSRAALALGWHSIFACSVTGAANHAKAGVAIFAREEIGLRRDTIKLPEHGGRLITALSRPPGWPTIRLVSAYLHTGVGIKGNAPLLADIGAAHSRGGAFPITGADWNIQHKFMQTTDLAARAWSAWAAPRKGSATCVTAKSSNIIDYFLLANQLVPALYSTRVVSEAGTPTHRPVIMTFKPNVANLHVMVLDRPKPIPSTRVVGPINKPVNWGGARVAAEEAVRHARESPAHTAVQVLTVAYRWLANTVAASAANAASLPPTTGGQAGHLPSFKWVHISELRKPVEPTQQERAVMATRWVHDRAVELRRLVGSVYSDGATSNAMELLDMHWQAAMVDEPIGAASSPYLINMVSRYRDLAMQVGDLLKGQPPIHSYGS